MPAPEVQTLDPAKVTLSADGTVITGFAPSEFIRAECTEDKFDLITGAHGHALRAKRLGRRGEIRFRLLPTSPVIAKLRQLALKDEPFEVVCTDSNYGADKGFVAEQAWIKRDAPFIRSTDAAGNVLEVVIETHNLVFK